MDNDFMSTFKRHAWYYVLTILLGCGGLLLCKTRPFDDFPVIVLVFSVIFILLGIAGLIYNLCSYISYIKDEYNW